MKLRKERDFHRMHHKRVVQEKDKLVAEIKRYVEVDRHGGLYPSTFADLRSS